MAFDLMSKKQTSRDWSCHGFSDDARKVMETSPNYFFWWYTVKSVSLGVVASGLAFMLGRASVSKKY